MKKNIKAILISLVIGFFLSYFILTRYKSFKGITVSNIGEEYYFLANGKYSSKEQMEEAGIDLENYVYRKDGVNYYMYVGITKNKDNAEKIKKYYGSKNINIEIKEFYISNKRFSEAISNLDNILINTTDEVVITEIINQGLDKYEEIILNGS
ncbi:MAG: hypothetical protein IJ094_00240 [Bacilli bacterium]|nr:hypothetical protein [Bacilli bacterium]